MSFGLTKEVIDKINACFSKYDEIDQAVIYGSRAKGNYRNGSDIDITLKGEKITYSQIVRLENDIDDLLLPYKFDISIFEQIDNNDLIDHINRVGKLFYKKSS